MMKPVLAWSLLWAFGAACAQPCEPSLPSSSPAKPGQHKALAAPELPQVRLRLELRDSLPSPGTNSVVSTSPSTGRPVLTLWTDNNQALEARMALQTGSSSGELQWLWSAQQGVVASPAAPHTPAPSQARWWFCPTWPGGTGLLRVRYEAPATDAAAFSPSRPALAGQISVPLDEWVPLWAPQAEPPPTGGDRVARSTHAAPLPRLDMRWRRE